MSKIMLVGCDLHDKNMLLMFAANRAAPNKKTFLNSRESRRKMIKGLLEHAREIGASKTVFAYEASGLGFGLYDELTEAGIICHVLAPTRIERSSKERRNKTDEKDALRILEILRGHYLAGNRLPDVWIPPVETRDDRELVRCRLDVQDKITCVKTQIRTLLKRNGIEKLDSLGGSWTRKYYEWLEALSVCDEPLASGARKNLSSLLRQLKTLEAEIESLDKDIRALSQDERYAKKVRALIALAGVGMLSAMVFLTELGDLRRFKNRRQIGSYLGVVPAAYESGEASDRKGHITHQGPDRVRCMLCQCAWNHVRFDEDAKAFYGRIVAKNPKKKKKALVAAMRRLAIRMWHIVLEVEA